MKFLLLKLFLLTCFFSTPAISIDKNFVTATCRCQLGNNLFQVAAASALAWENNAVPQFPCLLTKINKDYRLNYKHFFFRCNVNPLPTKIAYEWKDPEYNYTKIPYQPNLAINGFFQSEKYFKKYRDRILDLFAPLPEDLDYIQEKYGTLLNDPSLLTVGVQIRYYHEDPRAIKFGQYGKDYLTKATALFPKNALFIVSSNNKAFAKKSMPADLNVIYLDEPYFIEFRLLGLCQHNIITNSSFGWWSAWLNRNPEKIVVVPKQWFKVDKERNTKDVWAEGWIRVAAKVGNLKKPESCE